MYKKNQLRETSLNVNKSVEGESIEIKISRMINNKEPINTGRTELIYTERKEGVRPETVRLQAVGAPIWCDGVPFA